jgi:predicted nucleic-acid-binding protein
MRAVDTNLLVRVLARDDARQLAIAEAFIESGAWISQLVLAEAIWVLRANYAFGHEQIVQAIEMVLGHAHFFLEAPDVVAMALDEYRRRPSLRYFDCLILATARKAGHLPLGTFDKSLATLDGAVRL